VSTEGDATQLSEPSAAQIAADSTYQALLGSTAPTEVSAWCWFTLDPSCRKRSVMITAPFGGASIRFWAHVEGGAITQLSIDPDMLDATKELLASPLVKALFPKGSEPVAIVPSVWCDHDPIFQAAIKEVSSTDCRMLVLRKDVELAYYPALGFAWVKSYEAADLVASLKTLGNDDKAANRTTAMSGGFADLDGTVLSIESPGRGMRTRGYYFGGEP
jgi:hypothetical protein